MKLASWLKSLFSHSGRRIRRSRRSCRQRTTLRYDLEWHGNHPLPAWVEILETRVLLATTFGGQNTITSSADGARSVFASDVDGDGDMDLLSSSVADDTVAWYENDGNQNFTEHTISTSANGARSVFALDVDGDGDLDVLSASSLDDKIAWYENDDRPVQDVNFTSHTISTAADGAISVFAADMDGDGDIDVLSASYVDDKIAWYENDGSQNFTPHTISTAANFALSVFASDVDGDGDMDVLSASYVDDKIAWYENDGSGNFTSHTISTAADGAISVFAADVDGDGDMDVLSASFLDDKIAWYENDDSQNFTPHTISTAADRAYSVFATDLDGDGDLDVLSASSYDDKIAWYENDGSQNFTPHTISSASDGALGVFAADVDGDGDMDVLSASASDDKIAWYENLGNATPTLSIDDVSLTEGDSGETDFTFTISIAEVSESDVTVDFATADDSAVDPGDYTALSGTATIAAGATSTTVTVKVQGDTTEEVDETFFVNLSNPVNATIADNQGLGTIENDDAALPTTNLDVDDNGEAGALTDGVLIVRSLFGVTGTQLTDGALGTGAVRTDSADIIAFLEPGLTTMLDVDANGEAGALTDGVLIVRYLFGVTGTQLTDGALGTGALRTDSAEIITFLDGFLPAAASASFVVSKQDVLIANYDEPAVSRLESPSASRHFDAMNVSFPADSSRFGNRPGDVFERSQDQRDELNWRLDTRDVMSSLRLVRNWPRTTVLQPAPAISDHLNGESPSLGFELDEVFSDLDQLFADKWEM
jgi:hypothetical protein